MFWEIFVSKIDKISSLNITLKNTCKALTTLRLQGCSKLKSLGGKRPKF